MTAPEVPSGKIAASFYDGLSARRQPVLVWPSEDQRMLVLETSEGHQFLWQMNRLRALRDQSDEKSITLTLHSDEGDEAPRDPARLVVTDPLAILWFRRMVPDLGKRDVHAGTVRKVLLWLGAAAAAMVLMLFVILPALSDYLAGHLPVETETAFGRSVMRQVEWMVKEEGAGDLTCTNPDGLAALNRMKDRLIEGRDLGYDLQLSVFDHKMVNAFAVPGGQIVIFRGLLDKAEGPDEVAGVLAHEIGHVAARDPTRIALRAAGSAGILSMILGDVSGGTAIAAAGEYLMRASYTRDAEAQADRYALGLLDGAGISAEGLAGFFDRISADTDMLPEYTSSHPLSAGRAQRAHDQAGMQGDTRPSLDDADWAALKAICAKGD
ncbi:MAG: M48 family metallopeptidase [Defluviimonas denitrificans]